MLTPIQKQLFIMQDEKYKAFHQKLIPTVDPNTIIGVRTPQLRRFAKDYYKSNNFNTFMHDLPHKYYEENNLHAFLIEQHKNFADCIAALDLFLPYVDNWATCDMLRPKVFAKHLPQLRAKIEEWLDSTHPYTVRFGIEMLLCYFLNATFCPKDLERVAKLCSDEYYVNMMVAWYFATALAKQYEATLPYLQQKCLPTRVHNKTIQKAVESYCIAPEQKRYLRTLKK